MLNRCEYGTEYLIDQYVNKRLSLTEISKQTGIPVSSVRNKLVKRITLRGYKEAIGISYEKGLYNNMKRGHKMTEDTKRKQSQSAIRRWDGKRKGVSMKSSGYLQVTIGKNKNRGYHVIIMEQHIGRKIEKNEVVHHINGIRSDNRIENLLLMSRSAHSSLHAKENQRNGRCYDISTQAKSGEQNSNAKLSEVNVIEILSSKLPTKHFCKKFGISRSVVNTIRRRESWKNVTINN